MSASIRFRRWVWLAAGAVIVCHAVLAQRPPSSGGSASGPPAGAIPANANGTLGGPIPNTTLNRDIYLSGNVMLDDGTPPAEPVTIERVCAGASRAMAYTDNKGYFGFQLGHAAAVLRDAGEIDSGSAGSLHSPSAASGTAQQPVYNIPDAQLAACDLRAVLTGFRSDNIPLGGRRLGDDSTVGTIILHRLTRIHGAMVSATGMAAPKDAQKAYAKGLQAVEKADFAAAATRFRKAADLYPKFAAAWYELGKIQQRNQEIGPARESYAKALAADARFMGPYEQLARLALDAGNWRELADTTDRLIKLDPVDHPAAYLYNAMANLSLKRFDAAEKSAWAAEKLDTQHRYPKREEVLAAILAAKRNYAGAAEHLRIYLQIAPDADDAQPIRSQLAEYQRLAEAGAETAKTAEREAGHPEPR